MEMGHSCAAPHRSPGRMITVGNAKHGIPGGVYIGRAIKCWPASPLANPFHIGPGTNRYKALALYREWLHKRIDAGDPSIIKELERIKTLSREGDVRLVCWCKPKRCHGDIICEILEALP